MIETPCIIFAGGKSSRMGEDKALLPFGGESSLTLFQYKRLKKIFSHVYISCKDATKFDFEAAFILDPEHQSTFAPTAGFVALFDALDQDRFFVLSVDTPFVERDQIEKLFSHDREDLDAVIAKTDEGTHPMCGIYHRTLAAEFQKMFEADRHKLGMLLKDARTKFVYFDKEDAFINLNHPHEYKKALSLLSQDRVE